MLPRNGTEKPGDVEFGKCPNCACENWDEEEDGVWCRKCHHPWGESSGGADEEQVKTKRQKLVKTMEAAMRALDDLNHISPNRAHEMGLTPKQIADRWLARYGGEFNTFAWQVRLKKQCPFVKYSKRQLTYMRQKGMTPEQIVATWKSKYGTSST